LNLERQAEMLANRVRKSFRKLRPGFARRRIGAFRLYDRDIPEIRAVIDWYEGHLVAAEYARRQTEALPWLETMARAVAQALEVPWEKVHLKRRQTRPAAGARYPRLAREGELMPVSEGDLQFLVNLDDYIDTGLFPDHRETRARVRAEANGAAFLNLFAYTGSFTCAAALGGALSTTSVDASRAYLDWAAENLELNRLEGPQHELVRASVDDFLARAGARRWRLCVLDPPSFSDHGGKSFEVQRDHRDLIERTLAVLEPGGVLWFSTNHQRFEPRLDGLRAEDLTARTVPEDYRNRAAHRSFRILK
jgi:23S rRNA G2069 N7-methylase RlmK/C1962 C5-methylase RlmI